MKYFCSLIAGLSLLGLFLACLPVAESTSVEKSEWVGMLPDKPNRLRRLS